MGSRTLSGLVSSRHPTIFLTNITPGKIKIFWLSVSIRKKVDLQITLKMKVKVIVKVIVQSAPSYPTIFVLNYFI